MALAKAIPEPELRLVPFFCDTGKISVDIGAAWGLFSVHMCKASREVFAFEPRPRQAAELTAMFDSLELPVHVEAVALSSHDGTAQMRMLLDDLGRSTIEEENSLSDEDGSTLAKATVNVRRLDDYDFSDVAFIKLDVEGHEVSVLEGARATIAKNQPVLLIESEDRHRKDAVADVTAFMHQLGYTGFFLQGESLHTMDEFKPGIHQNPSNIGGWKSGWVRRGIYVNNFFFLPVGREFELSEAFRKSRK